MPMSYESSQFSKKLKIGQFVFLTFWQYHWMQKNFSMTARQMHYQEWRAGLHPGLAGGLPL